MSYDPRKEQDVTTGKALDGITRRGFLGAGATFAAAPALVAGVSADCRPQTVRNPGGARALKRYSVKRDIAVIGAGPAGLSAAIIAKRLGKSVVLVEKNGYLGGCLAIGISPLGFLDGRGRWCIGGFAREFMERLAEKGWSNGTAVCPKHNSVTSANAEGVKMLAAELVRSEGVDVLLHSELSAVDVENGSIRRATAFGKCNEIAIEAEIFIDCTGDGDLACLSGCEYEMSKSLQPPTVMFTLENVDQEALFRYVEKNPEELRYSPSAANQPKTPSTYTVEHFRKHKSHVFVGLQKTFSELKAEGKLPVDRASLIYINGTNPGEVYVNTTRLLNTDATDIFSLTKAELDGTLQIPKLVEAIKARVPGFERCFVSSVSSNLGVRETRRFSGVRRVTGEDAFSGNVPEDTVALSGYKIDVHSGSDSGVLFKDIAKPFGIPYGALVMKDVGNLLAAGRCISADAIALGSLRVMPTCMALGQAAATAATIALRAGVSPKDADVSAIRKSLLSQGAILQPSA